MWAAPFYIRATVRRDGRAESCQAVLACSARAVHTIGSGWVGSEQLERHADCLVGAGRAFVARQ